MSSLLHVEWTVLTAGSPQIKRLCGRCGCTRAFVSTGKFRLNANGNRLDAWLIYKCLTCGNRWNRALFERRALQSLSKELLEALQENNAEFARRVELSASTRTENRLPGGSTCFSINKRLLSSVVDDGISFSLTILNPGGCKLRVDRILAVGLGISRRSVYELADSGGLRLVNGNQKSLKRPLKDKVMLAFPGLANPHVPDLRNRLFSQDHTHV